MNISVYLNDVLYNPQNLGDLTITTSLDRQAGAFQYVKTLDNNLVFTGEAYTYILLHGECQKIQVKILQNCNGETYELYKGYFTLNRCNINQDRQTIEAEPREDTLYNCVLDNLDRKFNFLQNTEIVSAEYSNNIQLEYKLNPINDAVLPYYGDPLECGTAGNYVSALGLGFLYCREVISVRCNGGQPQPPAGTGWQLLLNNCTKGFCTFARKASVFTSSILPCSAFFANPITSPPPVTAANENWVIVASVTAGGTTLAFFVDYNYIQTPQTLTNGRDLMSVLNFGLNQFCPELDAVSEFFTNDVNPVTGESPSKSKGVQLHSISDIKDPAASEKATLEEITLKDILQNIVSNRFNCFWFVDENSKRLIIKHYKNLTFTGTTNINTLSPESLKFKNEYRYLKDNNAITEIFEGQDDDIDFAGVPIDYNNSCGETVVNRNLGTIYANVAFIINNPAEFGNNGTVLILKDSLNIAPNTSPPSSTAENGAITGEYKPNAPLGMANLQNAYWRHFRPFKTGVLNFDTVEFETVAPRKQQIEININECCVFFFNERNKYITNLTENGILNKYVFNLKTNSLELEIIY